MHQSDSRFEYMLLDTLLFFNLAKLAKLAIVCVIVLLRDCVIVMCTQMHFPDSVHQF